MNVRVGVALLLLLAVGCKKTSAACPDIPAEGDLDIETVAQMRKSAEKNTTFCKELIEPQISFRGGELVLQGPGPARVVGRKNDLAGSEIQGIDALYMSLGTYRRQWKELYPGKDGDGRPHVTFDAHLETARAMSVLLSAATAGYRNLAITINGATPPIDFVLPQYVQGPPDGRYIDRVFVIDATSIGESTSFTIRMDISHCKKTTSVTVNKAALAATVAQMCKANPKIPSADDPSERITTRCADSIEMRVPSSWTVGVTMSSVQAILSGLADQKPAIDIAVLMKDSEPKLSFKPTLVYRPPFLSPFAPHNDASAHCLPDGGTTDEFPVPVQAPNGNYLYDDGTTHPR